MTLKPTAKQSPTALTAPSFDKLPDSGFIRAAQLVPDPKNPGVPTPLPFSEPTLWRKVKAQTFPAPVKLSERVTAWNVGTVRAWMKAQEAQTYTPTVAGKNPVKRTAQVAA